MEDSKVDKPAIVKVEGKLWSATILCAACGGLLAVVISLSGFLNKLKELSANYFIEGGFFESELFVLGKTGELFIACAIALVVSFFVLDSSGLFRRLCVGGIALILLICATLPLVLWGVLLLPFYSIIAVATSWGAAVLYASQHTMRCDVSHDVSPVEKSVLKKDREVGVAETKQEQIKELTKTVKEEKLEKPVIEDVAEKTTPPEQSVEPKLKVPISKKAKQAQNNTGRVEIKLKGKPNA